MLDRSKAWLILFLSTALLACSPANAHSIASQGHADFLAGLLHPITGLDHVIAMVSVGIWGGILGSQAIWLLPVTFPMVMAIGGILGIVGVPIPGVEIGIALSGMILGLMVLFEVKPPLWLALLIVAIFAVFHGHAHGTELGAGHDAIAYSIAFVIATGLLHISGVAIGEIRTIPRGRFALRCIGGLIFLIACHFLLAALR